MRGLVLALFVVACAATFVCENDVVTHDEPTAIFTDHLVHAINCTLIRTAVWCTDCEVKVLNSTFVSAPQPVIGIYKYRSYSINSTTINAIGAPRNIILEGAIVDSIDNSGLGRMLDAYNNVIYIG